MENNVYSRLEFLKAVSHSSDLHTDATNSDSDSPDDDQASADAGAPSMSIKPKQCSAETQVSPTVMDIGVKIRHQLPKLRRSNCHPRWIWRPRSHLCWYNHCGLSCFTNCVHLLTQFTGCILWDLAYPTAYQLVALFQARVLQEWVSELFLNGTSAQLGHTVPFKESVYKGWAFVKLEKALKLWNEDGTNLQSVEMIETCFCLQILISEWVSKWVVS